MVCPRCSSNVSATSAACDSCGFTVEITQKRLGKLSAGIDPIMDVAHCLRLADRPMLEAMIDDFERRFPQVYLSLFLGVLPPDMTVAEAGFWLLNHGIRKRRDLVCDNRYGIILLVDPASHLAGISVGYALEALLPQSRLLPALQSGSHHLWHSNYALGIKTIVAGLDDLLRKAGKPRRRLLTSALNSTVASLGLKKWSGAAKTSPLNSPKQEAPP